MARNASLRRNIVIRARFERFKFHQQLAPRLPLRGIPDLFSLLQGVMYVELDFVLRDWSRLQRLLRQRLDVPALRRVRTPLFGLERRPPRS